MRMTRAVRGIVSLILGGAAVAGAVAMQANTTGAARLANARRPEVDVGPGPRLRLTVAGRCPTSDRGFVGVRSPGRSLTTRMVPAIAPTAARVCSYSGLDSRHPSSLVQDLVLGAAQARLIADSAAAVSLAHQNGAAYSCPADFGTEIAIALRYPGRPDVDLWYSPSGCSSLSNGRIEAMPAVLTVPEHQNGGGSSGPARSPSAGSGGGFGG